MLPDSILERHTSAVRMWNDARDFLRAAKTLGAETLPGLYCGCHGIELALKSYLRAHNTHLRDLRRLKHSLLDALDKAVAAGLDPPSVDVQAILEFLDEAHTAHEFRYGHTYHPPRLDLAHLMLAGSWALGAVVPAVCRSQGVTDETVPVIRRMRGDAAMLLES